MNRNSTKLGLALLISLLSALQGLRAQVAPQPSNHATEVTPPPVPIITMRSQASQGAPFELSPFVVSDEGSQRYLASSTFVGTRVRTDLNDIGSAIQVVTGPFLKNTNSTNAQDLLVYTANTEVGGLYDN